jgi:uncharacterized PurR-regulated membrane protein YhhQ (DUF165 family)
MLWLLSYVATIVMANVLILAVGLVPVPFTPYLAPAGVYMAAFALAARDGVHSTLGVRWTLVAVVVGAALSALLSPALALASGVAFLVSELADTAVYAPLRRRNLPLAVLASGLVGLVIDSALFLHLAFGSLEFLPGLVIAKVYVTVGATAVAWAWRRRSVREVAA